MSGRKVFAVILFGAFIPFLWMCFGYPSFFLFSFGGDVHSLIFFSSYSLLCASFTMFHAHALALIDFFSTCIMCVYDRSRCFVPPPISSHLISSHLISPHFLLITHSPQQSYSLSAAACLSWRPGGPEPEPYFASHS